MFESNARFTGRMTLSDPISLEGLLEGFCPHGLYRGAWLCDVMRYRIDMSQSRKGYARIDFPGRILALAVNRNVGPVWLVGISDIAGEAEKPVADGSVTGGSVTGGSVVVRADSAGEAVW